MPSYHPPGSPLLDVFNCICFSEHGYRDLPSQLSGGDLDGDRFYLMFDENAKLSKGPHPAAAYPIKKPVELDRQVTRENMTKHSLDFMETDQLGRIAVAHRVSADQTIAGTLGPKCLQLAALHSDAVDFSKTGIAVSIFFFASLGTPSGMTRTTRI